VTAGAGGHRRFGGGNPALVPDDHRGYFPLDKNSHRRDAPRYCPACAQPLNLTDGGTGIVVEYWVGEDRVFVCYCGACHWSGDVVLAARVIGHEAQE
jgi:hypothetical protein